MRREEASLFFHWTECRVGRQAFPRAIIFTSLSASDSATRPNKLVENPTQHEPLDFDLSSLRRAEMASRSVDFQP